VIWDAGTLLRVLVWGLVSGSVYMLLATGITLIFGVMKVVNFAHGELMMAGAFVTFILSHSLGLNPYVGVFVSMAAVGVLGIVIERFGFRRLRGTAKINEIFFSIALILILQNALARIFVPRFREYVQIKTPYATEVLDLGLITLRYDFVILLALAWAVLLGLWVVLYRTGLGRDVRGTSQNRTAAMLMGIRVERVDMRGFYAMDVPRTYVRCLRDQAVLPARAAEYAARLGVAPVDLDTDHGPMLSAPDALATILARL